MLPAQLVAESFSGYPPEARLLAAIETSEARAYSERLSNYLGSTITVGSVTPKSGGVAIVDSSLKLGAGQSIKLEWEVHDNGRGPRIADVKAAGVSMFSTRRSDFNSYIASHGGTVEPLVREREIMTTRVAVTLADPVSAEQAEVAFEAAFSKFNEVDSVMNEWRADSPLSRINAEAGHADLRHCLRHVLRVSSVLYSRCPVTATMPLRAAAAAHGSHADGAGDGTLPVSAGGSAAAAGVAQW